MIYHYIDTSIIDNITTNLHVNKTKKKSTGEVFTPPILVSKVLNLFPDDIFKNPNITWFDPSGGIGNFLIVLYEKLMVGLESMITDSDTRSDHIIKHMLYMNEIDSNNVSLCFELFSKINTRHKPNITTLDFFEISLEQKYDVILGNPPYQIKKHCNQKTKQIWHTFTELSLSLLKKGGFLSYILPNSWRNGGKRYKCLYDKLSTLDCQKVYMLSYKQTKQYFPDISISVDILFVKNIQSDNNTLITDIDNIKNKEQLHLWKFLPSGKYDQFKKLIATQNQCKVNLMYSPGMYETRYSHMSKIKTDDFRFPVCNSITKKNGMNCIYSNCDKGMFGIPKVIWSNGIGTYPIVDKNGAYALTQFSYAIVDETSNLETICNYLKNPMFIKLMNYVKYTNNKYNYQVIKQFHKHFYKIPFSSYS